jgi:hypothetical protein
MSQDDAGRDGFTERDLRFRPLTQQHFTALYAYVTQIINDNALAANQYGQIRLYVVWRNAHETQTHTWLGQVEAFDGYNLEILYFIESNGANNPATQLDDNGLPLYLLLPLDGRTAFDDDLDYAPPEDDEDPFIVYLQVIAFHDPRPGRKTVQIPKEGARMFTHRMDHKGKFTKLAAPLVNALLVSDAIPTAAEVSNGASTATSRAHSRSSSTADGGDAAAPQHVARRDQALGKLQETICKDRFDQAIALVVASTRKIDALVARVDVLGNDLASAQGEIRDLVSELDRSKQEVVALTTKVDQLNGALRIQANNARALRAAGGASVRAPQAAGDTAAVVPLAPTFDHERADTYPMDRSAMSGVLVEKFLIHKFDTAGAGKADEVKRGFTSVQQDLFVAWDARKAALDPIARLDGGTDDPQYVHAKSVEDEKLQKWIDTAGALWRMSKDEKSDSHTPTKYDFIGARRVARSDTARTDHETRLEAIQDAIGQHARAAALASIAAHNDARNHPPKKKPGAAGTTPLQAKKSSDPSPGNGGTKL